jgi:hypothetical protein
VVFLALILDAQSVAGLIAFVAFVDEDLGYDPTN